MNPYEERIKALEDELNQLYNQQKYGLVWEQDINKINDVNVSIKQDSNRSITKDDNYINHLLIEGDNYFALDYLKKEYTNKVDVVYIDPPYDTGNGRFIYKDTFSKQYKYIHSDWIDFIYQRLVLAKELMNEEGIIFISINDKHLAHLRLLCDDVFGEENFLSNFCWIFSTKNIDDFSEEDEISTLGSNLGQVKTSHEYILCYRKSRQGKLQLLEGSQEFIHSRITNSANKKTTVKIPQGIKCEEEISITYKGVIGGKSEPIHILNQEGMIIEQGILKNDVVLEANFRNPKYIERFFNGEEVIDKKGQKLVEIYLRKSGIPYTKKIKKGIMPNSVLSGFGDTAKWRRNLINVIGDAKFNYPKPYPLIQKLINIGTNKKDAIILDFFAGSGTTAQSVLVLNEEDKGTRQFIVCTNNENNICQDITYPFIHNLINGYTSNTGKYIKGQSSNLIFLEVKQIT